MVLLVLLCAYSGQRTVTQAFKRREKEDRERSGGDYKPVQVVDAEGDGKEHRDAAAGEFESAELAKALDAKHARAKRDDALAQAVHAWLAVDSLQGRERPQRVAPRRERRRGRVAC